MKMKISGFSLIFILLVLTVVSSSGTLSDVIFLIVSFLGGRVLPEILGRGVRPAS